MIQAQKAMKKCQEFISENLEMLNIFVALKIFAASCRSQTVNIFCDNNAVVLILQTGKTKDPMLANITRNIFMLAASLDIFMKFTHVPGQDNRVADLLSRWDDSTKDRDMLNSLVPQANWVDVPQDAYVLNNNI